MLMMTLDDEIYEISKDYGSANSRFINIHEKIFNRENIDGSLIQSGLSKGRKKLKIK